MKKEVILFSILFLTLAIFPFILADEESQVLNGYSCLQNQIETRSCSSLSFEEKVFSLMSVQKCESEILSSKSVNNCFPSSNCNVKQTAQAIFALDEVNENTNLSEEWLLSQNAVPKNLEWFLEIETSGPSSCTISYGDTTHDISINEARKINADAGSCLTLAQNDYWLKVSPQCYNEEISVSCESTNFLTTLLFKRSDSSTVHVSEDTHSSTKGGTTTEIVDSLCFGQNNDCNYEASLWASLALHDKGYDISKYIPYLIINVENNPEFIPESFLYFLTGEYRSSLLSKQKLNQYWDESGDRYYDTALSAWPFYWEEPTQWQNSRDWLLDVQGENGCWDENNLRNTAFILRSFWPEYFTAPECSVDSDCGEGKICTDNGICENPEIICGNGIKEAGEQCDGTDLNNKSCSSLDPSWEGSLSCDNNCFFNMTSCTEIPECENNNDCTGDEICTDNGVCVDPDDPGEDPVCGNGVKEAGEDCDGDDLNGHSCSTLIDSDWQGNVSCNDFCEFETNECTEIIECTDDGDCPGNELCGDNGFCEVPSGGDTDSCESKYDCSANQECVNNVCVDNEFQDCEDEGYYCMSESSCEGSILGSYSQSCNSPFKCCSEPKPLKTCEAQNGEICSSNEICQGGTENSASDILSYEICCTGGGECVEDRSDEEDFECEANDGFCRTSCNSGEQESLSYTCSNSGEICCVEKSSPNKKNTWFIWALLVLIVLATLGIIFRNKLRPLWMKIKSKFQKKKSKKGPGPNHRMIPPRRPLLKKLFKPRPPRKPSGPPAHKRPGPSPKRPSKKEEKSELDDVLQKLRDMSK